MMNFFFKIFQKFSKFLLSLIPINYKKNHKFLNKNQVTNSEIALSLLADKINPEYILDIGCGHGEWFLKCNNFFPNSKYLLFDGNNLLFPQSKNLLSSILYFFTCFNCASTCRPQKIILSK